jgi:hypothetical protein
MVGNFCPAVGSTGVISVIFQPPLYFLLVGTGSSAYEKTFYGFLNGKKRLKNINLTLGKVEPRTEQEDPPGEQTYSSTFSLTSALDRGGSLTPHPNRFTGKETRYPLYKGVGWAPGLL